MQVTIEIDMGSLAGEWEAIAYRLPCPGESWLTSGGVVRTAYGRGDVPIVPCIIVRRKWIWPSWLKARWYAEDKDGSQWGYMQKPELLSDRWETDGVTMARFDEWFEIPKIGGDWRQSLRENPNWRPINESND